MRVPARVAWARPELQPGWELSRRDADREPGFTAARRAAFQTGRMLVGRLAAEAFGTSGWVVATADCPRCGGPHGPVSVEGVPAVASVSHAEGLVVAALARLDVASRIGVDVERSRLPDGRAADLSGLLGGPRRTVLRRWTRIEALLKADGRGLRVDPADVRISGGRATLPGAAPGCRVATIAGPVGYTISVAWRPVARSF